MFSIFSTVFYNFYISLHINHMNKLIAFLYNDFSTYTKFLLTSFFQVQLFNFLYLKKCH